MIEPGMSEKFLLPYQVEGVNAIREFARQHSVAILADEPGLGKTRQALAYAIKPDMELVFSRVLIVATKSTVNFWRCEAIASGISPDCIQVVSSSKGFTISACRFIIASHDMVPRVLSALTLWEPELIIADEAHLLKTIKTKRSKAIRTLSVKALRRLALSGTPITNSALDVFGILYSLKGLHCIAPYSNYMKFGYMFCNSINNGLGIIFTGVRKGDKLKDLLSKCMIRRLKQDVLGDLPSKTFSVIPLGTSPTINRALERFALLEIPKTKLQLENGSVSVMELRKAIALEKLCESVEFIRELLLGIKKVVIFAYHVQVIKELIAKLKPFNPVEISGGVNAMNREKRVKQFQTDEECRVLVGQITAAGVGITLTAADTVVFVESSWVPSEIEQAVDRCHRIGQKNLVSAFFLTIEGSIDEYMLRAAISKQRAISTAVSSS